jgi:predicted cupin superfamily sugar epimerase
VKPETRDRIEALALAAHPEGGWYREVYRCPERVGRDGLPERFMGARAIATAILFLLHAGEYSRFHRLRADEVWCHNDGGNVHLYLLEPGTGTRTGRGVRKLVLGRERPLVIVPHDTWFAAEPEPGAAYVLATCFVAPGFEFADFELAERDQLLAEYPLERALVTRLTREFAGGDEA